MVVISIDSNITNYFEKTVFLDLGIIIPIITFYIYVLKSKILVFQNKYIERSQFNSKYLILLNLKYLWEIWFLIRNYDSNIREIQILCMISVFFRFSFILIVSVIIPEIMTKDKTRNSYLFTISCILIRTFYNIFEEIRSGIIFNSITLNIFEAVILAISVKNLKSLNDNILLEQSKFCEKLNYINDSVYKSTRNNSIISLESTKSNKNLVKLNNLKIKSPPEIRIKIRSKTRILSNDFSNSDSNKSYFEGTYILLVEIEEMKKLIKITRSLEDFKNLDKQLRKSYPRENYNDYFNKNFVYLEIKREDDFLQIKNKIIEYLNNFTSHPFLINDIFLNFIGLGNLQLEELFESENKFFRLNSRNNISEDTFGHHSEIKNEVNLTKIIVTSLMYESEYEQSSVELTIHYDNYIKITTKNFKEIENFLKSIDYKYFYEFNSHFHSNKGSQESKLVLESILLEVLNLNFKSLLSFLEINSTDVSILKIIENKKELTISLKSVNYLIISNFKNKIVYCLNFVFFDKNNNKIEFSTIKKFEECIEFIKKLNQDLGLKYENKNTQNFNQSFKFLVRMDYLTTEFNRILCNDEIQLNISWLEFLKSN